MKTEKQVNNEPTCKNTFSEVVEHGLQNGGIHLVSVKGHGKTRLLFSMAQKLRAFREESEKKTRVSSSNFWACDLE
jgi:hypothetical protein